MRRSVDGKGPGYILWQVIEWRCCGRQGCLYLDIVRILLLETECGGDFALRHSFVFDVQGLVTTQ